jgi:hypothetical protein
MTLKEFLSDLSERIMVVWPLAVAVVLFLSLVIPLISNTQEHCYYSSECRVDECGQTNKTTGRLECVPKTYPVIVYTSDCVKSVKTTKDSYIEAPVIDGSPDMKNAGIKNFSIDLKDNCGKLVYRERQGN